MRTVRIGDLRFVSTPIEPGSSAVRIHLGDRPDYFANVIATPRDAGELVYLSSHLSRAETLSVREWLAAAAAFYPDAQLVDFERMKTAGQLSVRRLALPR